MPSPATVIRRHPLPSFFVLAYALSWWAVPLGGFLPCGPLFAALIVTTAVSGRSGLRGLLRSLLPRRVAGRWYLIAVGLPIAVAAAAISVNLALGAPIHALRGLGSITALLVVAAGRMIDPLDGALGEEPGWRGFALPRLLADRSPFRASLILGGLVAGWHLPLVFLPSERLPPLFLPATVAVTFVYSWVYLRTGRSVFMTMLAHSAEGTIKLSALGLVGAVSARMTMLYTAAWCTVAAGLVLFDRATWGLGRASTRRGFGAPARLAALLALAIAVLAATSAGAAGPGSTFLVDRPSGFGALPSDGVNDAYNTTQSQLSASGRYVVFESDADGLLPAGADPDDRHVYVRDRQSATTTLVDAAADGTPADRAAFDPTISPDGTHVAFVSPATNLTADPTGGQPKVFVKSLTTGTVVLADRATGSAGAIGAGPSDYPVLSQDGTTVAFETGSALDAVADTNGDRDVYVRDLTAATTALASRPTGALSKPGSRGSSHPAISADGKTVAFESDNPLDAAHDQNTASDVYVRTGATTTLASFDQVNALAGNGGDASAPTITADGGRVAFSSDQDDLVAGDTNARADVFVRNVGMATTVMVSRPDGSAGGLADGPSFSAVISALGGAVSFASLATNLGAGSGGTGDGHTYVRTVATDETVLASRADGPTGEPAEGGPAGISGDGHLVLFSAAGAALPGPDSSQAYVRDVAAQTTELVSGPTGTTGPTAGAGSAIASDQSISADGSSVVFRSSADGLSADDDDRQLNAFVRDTRTGALRLLDTGPDGPAEGSTTSAIISADGRVAVFGTTATNLGGAPPDGALYRLDLASNLLEIIDRATGTDGALASGSESFSPTVSADGNRIAFVTDSALDAIHDTNATADVYVRDVRDQTTTLVSRAGGVDGAAGNLASFAPAIDAPGDRVAFASNATDLGDGSVTAATDVHVRDLTAHTTVLASRATGESGVPGNAPSSQPSLSADGGTVAFASGATNLEDGDTTTADDVHVRDLAAHTTALISREGADGPAGTGDSGHPALSSDGTGVAFTSTAANLLPTGVTSRQVLVRDRRTGTTVVGSRADGSDGTTASAGVSSPALSADGGCLVFETRAVGLEPDGYPSPDYEHVHVRDLAGSCPAAAAPMSTPVPTPPPVTGTDTDTTAPVITHVRAAARSVRLTLSERAKVTLTARRGKRRFSIARRLAAGRGRIRFGRRLRHRGRYHLRLVATDPAGNRSRARRVSVRVRHRRPKTQTRVEVAPAGRRDAFRRLTVRG